MKKLANIALLLLLLLIIGGAIFVNIKLKQKADEIIRLKFENAKYETLIAKNGETITRQEQNIMTLKQAKDLAEDEIKSLKALGVKNASTIVWLTTENKRLKLEASYVTPPDTIVIPGPSPDISSTYLKVPAPFHYLNDPWIVIRGTVKSTGVTIDSTIVYSKPSITLGWSTGFLKKSKPIVVWKDKNPYTTVLDMNNIVIQSKPKFYQTPMWHRLEGAAILFGIAKGVQAIK